jgi:hypothetical protein
MCDMYTWWKSKYIHRDKPVFSSERLLHKDYNRKGAVVKISLVVSLKVLGAKMKWLVVNRQSQSNFNFDFDL